MFPFGSVPPLVGVPGPLLPPAPTPAHSQPLQVLSLPLLAQPYQLPAQPSLQLVQPPPPPLGPPLVLHPQLPRAPPPPALLLRPTLRHAVVNPQVQAKVLGAQCVSKSPNAVKAATTPPSGKAPSAVKESDSASEANATAVAVTPICQQSEEKCEVVVKGETGPNREANGSVPEQVTRQSERYEKAGADGKPAPSDISGALGGDAGNPKVRKMNHVMILDEDRKFCAELSLEKDDTLSLKLLRRHFPGVCGLTFRSPDCPHRQWIACEGGKLRAPRGGWEHDVYYCVFSEQSGGKWLHTFCHCSFSKPSKSKRAKSPVKSRTSKSDPVRNRANEVSGKSSQSEEPDVYVVEDGREGKGRQKCPEMVVCSLPQWVTDAQLREHFAHFGKVITCTVQKDLVGARYGLVKFRDLSAREKALAEVFHRFGDTWCSVRPHS